MFSSDTAYIPSFVLVKAVTNLQRRFQSRAWKSSCIGALIGTRVIIFHHRHGHDPLAGKEQSWVAAKAILLMKCQPL